MFEISGILVGIGVGAMLLGSGLFGAAYGRHFVEHPTLAQRYDVMSRSTQQIWKWGLSLVGIGLLIVLLCQLLAC